MDIPLHLGGSLILTEPVIADFIVVSPWDGSSGAVEVFNMSAGAGGYQWSMGDGETYTDDTPEHWYTESGTFTITLTAFSEDGECSSQTTNDVISNWVSVEELESGMGEVLAYHNPTSSEQLLEFSGDGVEFIQIFDAKGSTILSHQIPKTNRVKLDFSSFEKGVYTVIAGGYPAIRVIVQ